MTRIKLKNLPRLSLADLLRRRKMSLQQLLSSFGITTYVGLVNHCDRIGVMPPTEVEFKVAHPQRAVNNPQEGVIVLEPLPTYHDDETENPTGEIDPAAYELPDAESTWSFAASGDIDHLPDTLEGPQKKSRRKKEANQGK